LPVQFFFVLTISNGGNWSWFGGIWAAGPAELCPQASFFQTRLCSYSSVLSRRSGLWGIRCYQGRRAAPGPIHTRWHPTPIAAVHPPSESGLFERHPARSFRRPFYPGASA
jgi:hypothetical protein